ncbi:MAG: UDP-N-acetylmuramoyl-L-alanine--D-glutamate ligase [Ilumatobacter sp.]|nr:UDP-N-acetylmuramoyl-L-alanine--D-glutamate ligase [Ilumatobacter sp.]
MSRTLVYGLAVAGASTVRALRRHGHTVVVVEDVVDEPRLARAAELDVELVDGATADLDRLLADCSLLCPSPGVPEAHPVIDAAQRLGVPIVSEIELAYRWEQERPGGPRPMLAVTGTDGKTTTTKLAVAMLAAAGVRSVDAGNTDTPLVDAIEQDLDAFVVECSSFRLAWTPTFRAEGAVWLNLQPDHLNWHRSLESYEAAKARIFVNQRPTDVAIGFADDPAVMGHVATAPGRAVTFGFAAADYHVADDALTGPGGVITTQASMRRALPHDVTNALAAAALVLETGLADTDAIRAALATFTGPPHRLEQLGTWGGVGWYNDSKATTPHAAAAAIRSFDRIVLIAGGADKGVDLAPMAAASDRLVGVIAIGTTASAIAATFAGVPRVEVAGTLERAVEIAQHWAVAGDTVLLSPGCASLDQFRSFEARGDAFRALVDEQFHDVPPGVSSSDPTEALA